MAGIVSYGAYIPIYRLSRETLNQVWGSSLGKGERVIINSDEDSITMAVEAVIDCLNGMDRQSVDGLYFASTTSPFREKQCASIVAAAADLRKEIITADFANSLRAGTNAINAGIDAIKGGSAKRVMVAASDCRLPPPNSGFESVFGDGAAAVLLGNSDVAVDIEASSTCTSEFVDSWRIENDIYPRMWEDRFVFERGYDRLFPQAVSGLLKKCGLTPKDFNKAVFYGPDARRHRAMGRVLGFDAKTQVQDPMFDRLGNTGAAFALMMLVAALEKAKAGDRILFANYTDGADVYVLRVTEQIEQIRDRRGIEKCLASKMIAPNYGKYLRGRNMMEWGADLTHERRTALTIIDRQSDAIYALHGHKCRQCGGIQYPKQRACIYCQAEDDFDDIRLSDKKGTLFTYSMDERAVEIDLPKVISVVDLEGGGRLYTSLTDRDTAKVEVGMPVELTFRKIHDALGFHNYFWKARPIRC